MLSVLKGRVVALSTFCFYLSFIINNNDIVLTSAQMDGTFLVQVYSIRRWAMVPKNGWKKVGGRWSFLKCLWKCKGTHTFCCCRHFVQWECKVILQSYYRILQNCSDQLVIMTFSRVTCHGLLCHAKTIRQKTVHYFFRKSAHPPYPLEQEHILKEEKAHIHHISTPWAQKTDGKYTLIKLCLMQLSARVYISVHTYSCSHSESIKFRHRGSHLSTS